MADKSLRSGLWTLGLGLLPTLAAIWLVPDFVTQDGPAHLYNAEILAHSSEIHSPYASAYAVHFDPLPNWAGHLLLWGLLEVTSPLVADRVVFSLTLIALAASIVWLKYTVSGSQGLATTSLLAIILGLNVTWLLGFTSFLLGAALFPITLGVWWRGRHHFGPGRALGLSLLVVAGYVCHLVSLGLTVGGVVILALFTPGENRGRRALWTALGLLPVLPLLVLYKQLSNQGGPLHPEWQFLGNPWSLSAWVSQLGWVDPVSLASKVTLPFVAGTSKVYALFTPVVWFGLGLLLLAKRNQLSELRGWLILAILLIAAGVIGPDSLGTSHGHYLPQRVLLLGLVALVPCLAISGSPQILPFANLSLVVALVGQTLFVWDYALTSNQTAGAIHEVAKAVGHDQRVATILVDIRGKSRANPLLHADNLLGVGTGNIIWNNYETNHYYFPVQFRPGVDHPSAFELEEITKLDKNVDERARRWERLLDQHHQSIDVLVMWGADTQIDVINTRWFEKSLQEGAVQVFKHRPSPSVGSVRAN